MREIKPVHLKHIPSRVAQRLDELYATVKSGSVTVHKNDGEAVKFEIRNMEKALR